MSGASFRERSVNRAGARVRLLSGSHLQGVWFESSALRHISIRPLLIGWYGPRLRLDIATTILKTLRFSSLAEPVKGPPATEDSVLSAAGAGGSHYATPGSFRLVRPSSHADFALLAAVKVLRDLRL